ncbi:MAG: hypothetical protein JWR24_5043 [Actinoallomurus sp.]|nr:hypothetical protein [Actinoallomurus sp.]
MTDLTVLIPALTCMEAKRLGSMREGDVHTEGKRTRRNALLDNAAAGRVHGRRDRPAGPHRHAGAARPRRRNEILAVGGGITAAAPIVAYLAAFGPNLPWHV